jgi:hypothetical protein
LEATFLALPFNCPILLGFSRSQRYVIGSYICGFAFQLPKQ